MRWWWWWCGGAAVVLARILSNSSLSFFSPYFNHMCNVVYGNAAANVVATVSLIAAFTVAASADVRLLLLSTTLSYHLEVAAEHILLILYSNIPQLGSIGVCQCGMGNEHGM